MDWVDIPAQLEYTFLVHGLSTKINLTKDTSGIRKGRGFLQ